MIAIGILSGLAPAVLALTTTLGSPASLGEVRAPALPTEAEPRTATTPGEEHKITICHKGRAISVDVAAWPAHEAHGDFMGECLPACLSNADCAVDEYCSTDVLTSTGWEVGNCGEPGTCEPLPGPFCPAVYDPVCGCDGRTYGNTCEAHVAGVNIESFGPCGAGS